MGGVLLKSVPNMCYIHCGCFREHKGGYRFCMCVLYIVFLITVPKVSFLTCVLHVLFTLTVTG